MMVHLPVLQKEVLYYLNPKANENFIDCTIGEAGHSSAILERTEPRGKILGIDWNPEILKNTTYNIQNTKYKNRVILVCDNFANLKEIVKREKFSSISGILFDLGLSSWHLEKSGRGFSFQRLEPLDMRFSLKNLLTAEKILNYWSELELAKILREYGEEKFAKQISKEIIKARIKRPIRETFQLVKIIQNTVPIRYQHQKIHVATRTFQALRIAVNDESNNLERALSQAVKILNPGGRLAIISFHSLEDRIVKNFLKNQVKESPLKILTKKPIKPSLEEVKINPRSRSAKLRAALKSENS